MRRRYYAFLKKFVTDNEFSGLICKGGGADGYRADVWGVFSDCIKDKRKRHNEVSIDEIEGTDRIAEMATESFPEKVLRK